MYMVILKYAETQDAWEAKVKGAEDRAVSTKRGHLEAIKLKEDMATQLKEGELIKEHGRVVDVVA